MAVHTQIGATTLPYSSQYRTGRLTFAFLKQKVSGGYEFSGTFPLSVYATSGATNVYDNTWFLCAKESFPANYDPRNLFGEGSIEWSSSAFVGAKSIAIAVGYHTDSYVSISVNPYGLYYSTTNVAIYDSGAGVGQFNWFATDGGLKG